MIVTHKIPYRDGELRIGWASWDDGSLTDRSIKYAYPDSSGKISRGAPELPLDMLMDMLGYAAEQGEVRFDAAKEATSVKNLSRKELQEQSRVLKSALLLVQKVAVGMPWADFKKPYDQIGARYESIKAALEKRAT
jgi:hypothetical protein